MSSGPIYDNPHTLIEVLAEGPYKGKKFIIKKCEGKLGISFIYPKYVDEIKDFKPFTYRGVLLCSLATDIDISKYKRIYDEPPELREYVLNIVKDPLSIFKLSYNTLEDLLSPFELDIYNHAPPSGTCVLENALNKKLKEDPSYEVFAPFRCWKSVNRGKTNSRIYLESKDVLVSNLGRVVRPKRSLVPIDYSSRFIDDYAIVSVHLKGHKDYLRLHRVVASIFITPKGDNANTPLTRLDVNHINGEKDLNNFLNLEWVTVMENMTHAIATGLRDNAHKSGLDHPETEIILVEVVTAGKFLGFKCLIIGHVQALKHGFNMGNVNLKSGNNMIKGCFLTLVDRSLIGEYPLIETLDKETQDYLRLTKREKKRLLKTN